MHPADAGYVQLAGFTRDAGFELIVHAERLITDEALAGFDLLVIPHAADDEREKTTGVGSPKLTNNEIDSIEGFVIAGGSLIILAETEQPKYGNNFALLSKRFGISILNTTMQDPTNSYKNVPTWILVDLLSSQHLNISTSQHLNISTSQHLNITTSLPKLIKHVSIVLVHWTFWHLQRLKLSPDRVRTLRLRALL